MSGEFIALKNIIEMSEEEKKFLSKLGVINGYYDEKSDNFVVRQRGG